MKPINGQIFFHAKSHLTHQKHAITSQSVKDDIGEEPEKSDSEINYDEEMKEKHKSVASATRRRGQVRGENEEEDDGDEENEFRGNDDEEMEEEEEEVDEEDEEFGAKRNAASGNSPATSNNNNKNKRQRSSTPPPVTHPTSSFDGKMQLTTNLLYLNGTNLGHVMSLLEQHCPKVLEIYNNDDNTSGSAALPIPECMEINMDLLMDEYFNIFTMIQQYCNDHMVKKRYAASAHGGNVAKIKDISNRRKERRA